MLLFLILFGLVNSLVLGANILVINPMESASHHIWVEVLIQGLLEKGHNMTLLGHRDTKIKSDNYTVYKITGLEKIYDDIDFAGQQHTGSFSSLMLVWRFTVVSGHLRLKSKALESILEYPRNKFDIIMFNIFCGQELYPLIEYFGYPPVIGIITQDLTPFVLDTMGSHFYFYYPHFHIGYTDDMTFLQRTENTLLYIAEYFLKWHHMPKMYEMAQSRYGKNIIPFNQIERKIEILLANYDSILQNAQPLPPYIIPVAGLHVKRPEKLPKDLQAILDNANNGILYFSFGTIVEPSWLSEITKKIFLNVFSKLNETVLWKYTEDDLKDIPKNVIIKKWYPQNGLLAHKNVKLFITHGGSLSSYEAMYHGVPVLGIPFFGDQRVTTEQLAARRLGKKLLIKYLTEDILLETILEIINNSTYKQNMQKMSRIFRDQKETPLERAIFWVEYTLKHKDLSHLSTKSRDMTLFQRENLDVYGVILIFILIILTFFCAIIKVIVSRLIFKIKHKIKQN